MTQNSNSQVVGFLEDPVPCWNRSCVTLSIDSVDAAYIAGIIDGEGSIQICRHRPFGTRISTYHQLLVTIEMGDSQAISFIREKTEHIGNTIQKLKKYNGNTGFRHRINFYGKKAAELLVNILPYLKVKHDQAEKALEFYEKCRFSSGNRIISDDQFGLRETYAQVLKEMKKNHV